MLTASTCINLVSCVSVTIQFVSHAPPLIHLLPWPYPRQSADQILSTLLQDSFIIFQQARGLSVYTLPCGECTGSLITRSFSNDRDYIFFFDPDTRFLHHLLAGLGTILCTMHLAMRVLFLLHSVLTSSSLRPCFALMTTLSGPSQLALKCVHFTDQDFKIFTRAPYILMANHDFE